MAYRNNKLKNYIQEHMILSSISISILIGMLIDLILLLTVGKRSEGIDEILIIFLFSFLIGCFFVLPITLTLFNLYQLLRCFGKIPYQLNRGFDSFIVSLGILYSILYLHYFKEVKFISNWNIALYNSEIHTPIFTQAFPTILTIAIISICGYIFVSHTALKNTPPLMLVLGISSMYLGNLIGIIWAIQTFCTDSITDLFLVLLPFNGSIITAKTIKHKIDEWYTIQYESHKIDRIPTLRWCNQQLQKSERWPIIA